MNTKRLISLLILFHFSQGFSLKETISLSILQDPCYKSQVLLLKADLFQEKIAFGKLSPTVDLSLLGSKTTTNNLTTAQAGGLQITISANLYDAGLAASFKKGKLETRQAKISLSQLQNNHIVDTSTHYLNTLKSFSNLKVKQFVLNQYQQGYQEALDKKATGLISEADMLAYQSNLDLAKLSLTISKNDLDHKISTLEGQINTPVASLHIFSDTVIPQLEVAPLSNLIEHAISKGIHIQLARVELEKARNDLITSESKYCPKANISYVKSQTINALQNNFLDNNFSTQKISVNLSLNAFSGFSDFNTIKQKQMTYQAAQASLEEKQYTIKLRIKKYYQDHENNVLQANAALSAVNSTNASLKATTERHKAGQATELEYATAIAQDSDAKETFYKSIYTLMACYLHLKETSSTLDGNSIDEINQYLKTEISLSPTQDLF
jgi:outer membrane protein TolC